MAMRRFFIGLTTVGFVVGGIGWANAQEDDAPDDAAELQARQSEIDTRSRTTLDDLLESNNGAKSLFAEAAGYAVFAATKVGGFLVTGAGGSGVVVNKGTGGPGIDANRQIDVSRRYLAGDHLHHLVADISGPAGPLVGGFQDGLRIGSGRTAREYGDDERAG